MRPHLPSFALELTALAALAVPTAIAPQHAEAKAKPKAKAKAGAAKTANACDAKVLPLAEGNTWSYTFVPPKEAAPPDIERIAPPAPKAFVITVKSVDTKDGDTVVTLEEKITYELKPLGNKKPELDDRVVTSTITCNAKKFDISPESFFFAGEPGGFRGTTIDKLERKAGTSWQLNKGSFGEAAWPEDLVIDWSHKPTEGVPVKLATGKLHLERRFQPAEPEKLVTKAGTYDAEKLALTTTGRVTLAKPMSSDSKPAELPADWINQLWFVEGTGIVQALNRYAHQYQLVDFTVK